MLSATLLAATDAQVPAIWSALERAAAPSYFASWAWIENWIAMLRREELPQLLVVRDEREPLAACFVGVRRERRYRVIPSRVWHLNTTGVAARDELCIEHNRLLARPGHAWSLAELVQLLPAGWDELLIPAADDDAFTALDAPPGFRVRIDREVVSPYVDLARVRAAGTYVAVLSANTRAQLRRARRAAGPCELEVATTVGQALAIYDELVALHTARWRDAGQPGAFADPWIDAFHRRLIAQRFAHGEIQMLRVRAVRGTLGCLYNLAANGDVLFYQSGLAPAVGPADKPGFVVHAMAVEHCAERGYLRYDLLGGAGRYKASLATDTRRLLWLRAQRTHVRFAVEDRLRHWKRALARALT